MFWLRSALIMAIGLHFAVCVARGGDNPPKGEKAPKATAKAPLSQAELDKKFAERMSGVVFSGHYSVISQGNEKPPQMEKYTISKAVKLSEDYWLFTARVQYGQHDVTVPMTLQVKWAGDTPVITLSDLTIPGLGTFTSRVVIYGDLYAGTWQHGQVGGHLWGKLEKAKEDSAKDADQEEKKKEEKK